MWQSIKKLSKWRSVIPKPTRDKNQFQAKTKRPWRLNQVKIHLKLWSRQINIRINRKKIVHFVGGIPFHKEWFDKCGDKI